MNRDAMRRQIDEARAAGVEGFGSESEQDDLDPDGPMDDGNPMGMPEAELTMVVDVSGYLGHKRKAIGAHSSQVSDSSFFMQMPDEVFAMAFGQEWFIEHGVPPGLAPGWFFES